MAVEQPSGSSSRTPGCSTVTPGGPPAGALIGPVLNALRAHSNPVRGFGHALEPDLAHAQGARGTRSLRNRPGDFDAAWMQSMILVQAISDGTTASQIEANPRLHEAPRP